MKIKDLICREPYRFFFPLGVLIGVLGVGHWWVYAFGFAKSYSAFFHAVMPMQAYLACFAAGFLMTAIPRLTVSSPASAWEVSALCGLFLGVIFFGTRAQWIAADACHLGWLLILLRFIGVRIAARLRAPASSAPFQPPLEFVWVPIGIFHGLIGNILLMLGHLHLIRGFLFQLGEGIAKQGFILAVVTGVGGFLGPRLMGRFQPSSPGPSQEGGRGRSSRTLGLYLLMGALFFLSFILQGKGWSQAAFGLRALIVTAVFLKTRVLPKPPRVPDLYVWMLWIAFWLVAAGLWIPAFLKGSEKTAMHVVFIGGFSLMIYAVATMVIYSHSGYVHRLSRPQPALLAVSAGLLTAMILRLLAPVFPESYFRWLGAASSLWILSSVLWLASVFPYLGKRAEEDEMERIHEEARNRLLKPVIKSELLCKNTPV